jgi:hypothetical protein
MKRAAIAWILAALGTGCVVVEQPVIDVWDHYAYEICRDSLDCLEGDCLRTDRLSGAPICTWGCVDDIVCVRFFGFGAFRRVSLQLYVWRRRLAPPEYSM